MVKLFFKKRELLNTKEMIWLDRNLVGDVADDSIGEDFSQYPPGIPSYNENDSLVIDIEKKVLTSCVNQLSTELTKLLL